MFLEFCSNLAQSLIPITHRCQVEIITLNRNNWPESNPSRKSLQEKRNILSGKQFLQTVSSGWGCAPRDPEGQTTSSGPAFLSDRQHCPWETMVGPRVHQLLTSSDLTPITPVLVFPYKVTDVEFSRMRNKWPQNKLENSEIVSICFSKNPEVLSLPFHDSLQDQAWVHLCTRVFHCALICYQKLCLALTSLEQRCFTFARCRAKFHAIQWQLNPCWGQP